MTEFNIGVKSPVSNMWNIRCLYRKKRTTTSGSQEKMQLMVDKSVHLQRHFTVILKTMF